jgi:hypothetical protein
VRRGRGRVLQLEEEIIRIAVVPALAGLIRPDDGMTRGVIVGRGVPPRGGVTAADVTALLADAEVNPVVPSGGQALDASWTGGSRIQDLLKMVAIQAHRLLPSARGT